MGSLSASWHAIAGDHKQQRSRGWSADSAPGDRPVQELNRSSLPYLLHWLVVHLSEGCTNLNASAGFGGDQSCLDGRDVGLFRVATDAAAYPADASQRASCFVPINCVAPYPFCRELRERVVQRRVAQRRGAAKAAVDAGLAPSAMVSPERPKRCLSGDRHTTV
ncbi:hypothetical protein MMC14_010747 [Varicellaria rhodocarpa]|nr:hypothetical protein [Varicellaria rhodocarpa]